MISNPDLALELHLDRKKSTQRHEEGTELTEKKRGMESRTRKD
jgi:hypothetical protein